MNKKRQLSQIVDSAGGSTEAVSQKKSRQEMSGWLKTEEALRVTRAQLWSLSAQHANIQENERRRIAVELHDGLGQILSLVKLTVDEAASSVDAGARTKDTLRRLSSQVKTALDEVRRIAMNLRPSTLDHLGIVATLSWYFRELASACPNTIVEPDISACESDVPDRLKLPIFRIVQESTSNAVKHAKAGRIKISLTCRAGMLELLVEDNGTGFEVAKSNGQHDFKHGMGLQSMKERAELCGGNYEFQSTPGQGTKISVRWLPVQASNSECPVIPINQAVAQTMCKEALMSELSDNFSTCLTCVRSLKI